jgi:hypothetical protein
MRKILRRMPSPAMVVACLALTVALGGTSYAAITLPRNSVGTAQLRANSISAPKLQERSVGPNKLQANAVSDRVVKSNALTGTSINEATLGTVPLANDANKLGGNTVMRLVAAVAPGGAEATVLNLNGLVVTLACPAGAVALRANSNSPLAAQLRFEGFGAAASFGGGSASLTSTSNVDLNNSENRGSGSANYLRADGTAVTAFYGWREDALGGTTACRVFGVAISG